MRDENEILFRRMHSHRKRVENEGKEIKLVKYRRSPFNSSHASLLFRKRKYEKS